MSCSSEGIEPAQAGKPYEVAVRSMQDRTMFDRERANLGVAHEVPGGPKMLQNPEDFLNVIGARIEHLHHALTQPGANVGHSFVACERILEGAWIGDDADKPE